VRWVPSGRGPGGRAGSDRVESNLAQLRHYDRSWLRGDVIAGVTVAAYLIPQVMAYAGVAGLPPVAGLWSSIVALLAYAVFGSSRRLSIGPESTTALLTSAAIAPLAAGDPGRYATLAAALAVMVGLVCLAAWLARLGFLADALSRPVLVGYMTGIAVLMVASQLGTLTGGEVHGDSFRSYLSSFAAHVHDTRTATPVLAGAVLLFLIVAGRAAPKAPVPLIAVALAVVAVAVLGLDHHGVALVGDIPTGLPPAPSGVPLSDLGRLVGPSLGLAIVAYTDNVLTGRSFAVRHHEETDAARELLALAAANVAAGAAHGFPVSSSGSRTAIGDAVGARSQLHSLVVVAVVVLTLGVFEPVLSAFPKAALGALVVWAAMRLVDVPEFRRIARFRRSELVLALATTASVLVLDVLLGVLVAVGLSILDLLRRVARPHDGVLGYVPGVAGMHDVDDYPGAHLVPGLLVYRYDSPLFFANADNFVLRALAALDQVAGDTDWFILNAEANVQVDVTSLDALDDLRRRLQARGIIFALARAKHELMVDLQRAGFTERLGEERVFPTLPTAVEAYATWYEARHGSRPQGLPPPAGPPSPPIDHPG
jgi:sulfate permease, SulP family